MDTFTEVVWMCVILTAIAAPLGFYAVSRAEERVVGCPLREWSRLLPAAWYVFGTLLGESITRDTRSERAWATR